MPISIRPTNWKLILAFALSIVLFSPCRALAADETVQWLSTLGSGSLAYTHKGFELLYYTSSKVPLCTKMDELYSDARVAKWVSDNFYAAKADPQKSKWDKDSYSLHGGGGFPCTAVCDPISQKSKSFVGYKPAGEFELAVADLLLSIRTEANDQETKARIDNRLLSAYGGIIANYSSAQAYSRRAQTYLRLGNGAAALRDARAAISLDPGNLALRHQLTESFIDNKHFDEGLELCNSTLSYKPEASTYIQRGCLLMNSGKEKDLSTAISDFEQAIKLTPTDQVPYNNKALIHIYRRQYGLALGELNTALTIDPQNVETYANRALAYAGAGSYDSALADAEKAISLDSDPRYSDTLGYVLLSARRPEASLEAFQKSAVRTQYKYATWLGMGAVLKELGRTEQSSEYLEKSAREPDFFQPEMWMRAAFALPEVKAAIARAAAKPGFAIAAEPLYNSVVESPKDESVKNQPVGDKWALVIGISHFQNPAYDLRCSAQDAEDFAKFLVNEEHFAADHVRKLIDSEATARNIRSAFGDDFLPRLAEPADLVVVYISTHGTPATTDKGGKNYIVAYDTDRDHLYSTGVPMDELCDRIKNAVKCQRVLIVLDTCYSGGATPGARTIVVTPDNFNARDLAQSMGAGRLVICSSGPNQRSWESKNYPNGVFTRYLLNALRQNHGNIDVRKAFDTIKEQVYWEVKRDYGTDQIPQLEGKWSGEGLFLSVLPARPRAMGSQSMQCANRIWREQAIAKNKALRGAGKALQGSSKTLKGAGTAASKTFKEAGKSTTFGQK